MIAPGTLVRPRASATYRSEFIEVYKTSRSGDSGRVGVMSRDMIGIIVCSDTGIEALGWCMVLFDGIVGWVYHLVIEPADGSDFINIDMSLTGEP